MNNFPSLRNLPMFTLENKDWIIGCQIQINKDNCKLVEGDKVLIDVPEDDP